MNVIQMDTREKTGKKDNILRYLDAHGVKVIRSKLYCGDWTRLDNQTVCIDTKKDLQEVYSNVITDHDRFRSECVRAAEAGIRLVILVEQRGIRDLDQVHEWVNPRARRAARGKRPPVDPGRLQTVMRTMSERYGIDWVFCDPEDTGKVICDILQIREG